MGLFANVATLVERLYLKQNLLDLEFICGKKQYFSTGLQKKITYFIVILKTLGAFALQDLLKSCGESKFSTFILHMSAV